MDIRSAAAAYSNMAGITAPTPPAQETEASGEPSFSQLVENALGSAADSGYKAEKISTLALMGKADLTQLTTAVGDAEQALNVVVAMSSKIISAYQQISQMPM